MKSEAQQAAIRKMNAAVEEYVFAAAEWNEDGDTNRIFATSWLLLVGAVDTEDPDQSWVLNETPHGQPLFTSYGLAHEYLHG